jgi:hypothetical protein
MKSLITLALLPILFSCTEFRFTEPVPQDGKVLKAIPKSFHGIYADEEGDTLRVFSNYYSLYMGEEIGTIQDTINDSADERVLSDGTHIFVNLMSDDNTWSCYVGKLTKEGIDILFFSAEEIGLREMNNIARYNAVLDEDEEVAYYLIRVTDEQFKGMLASPIMEPLLSLKRVK